MIPRTTSERDSLALSNVFLRQCRMDDAYGGYCAKGVANLLEHVGLGCQRGHAYTWKDTLPQNGWIKLEGVTPENAPPGAVLIYDRSPRGVRNNDGKGGDDYGHVEIVTEDVNGRRQYVSDKARNNWGGSVPQNFVGVYVHPSLHKTNDGIHYEPNLDPRGGTMLASNRSGANGQKEGAQGYDPAMLAILNNRTNQDEDDPSIVSGGGTANNSDLFNNNANLSAFLVLAMFVSTIYGVEMNTGGQQITPPDRDPVVGGSMIAPGVQTGSQT